VLAYGDALVPVAFALMALLLALLLVLLWIQAGARWIAVFWVWRQALAWWRARSGGSGGPPGRRPGGAGGARESSGHSARYRAVMGSRGWRRRRRSVLRVQGGRCAVPGCTQRAVDVHHAEGYARLGRERLDELLGVCERHHRQLHGR
jgi:hypothetical protein